MENLIFFSIDDAVNYIHEDIEKFKRITPISLLPCSTKGDHGYSEYIEVAKRISIRNIEALRYIGDFISNKDYVDICKYAIKNPIIDKTCVFYIDRYRRELNDDYLSLDGEDKTIEGFEDLIKLAVEQNPYSLSLVEDDISNYDEIVKLAYNKLKKQGLKNIMKDMLLMSKIYSKTMQNKELTISELKYLYDVYETKDYAIASICWFEKKLVKELRNIVEDLNRIFDVDYFDGNISICTPYLDGLILPRVVDGFLYFEATHLKNIKFPSKITICLSIEHLENVENVIIPNELDCRLYCPLADNDLNELKKMCKGKTRHK